MKMATPNYEINYDDQKFLDVEADKQAALNEVDATYGKMISNADKYYQNQINAAQNWADKQSQLQQERTDFTIEQINQQKDQTEKDYIKEQSGAYVDWQKQSNQYGAKAEAMAAQGLAGSGFSESSQVAMYNTYQNRVATAIESYNRAVLNYDNAIKDAQLQNNALLAEIAYNTLQTQLELSLQGFQYKNDLVISQTNKKLEVENQYYNRYQDVLAQLNKENALAEEARQFNASQSEASLTYEELLAALRGERGGQTETTAKAADPAEDGAPDTGSFKDSVANKHTNDGIYIDRVGNIAWAKLFEYVKAGKIEQTKNKDGKLQYTWVGDKPVENKYADDEDGSTSDQPLYINGHGSVTATKQTVPMEYTDYNGKKQKINATVYKTKDGKLWIYDPVTKEYVEFTS